MIQSDYDKFVPGVAVQTAEQQAYMSHPGISRRKRPSSAMWRLILLLGDSLLIVTSLLLVMLTHRQLRLEIEDQLLDFLPSKIIVVCIGLISWAFAVNLLHTQEFKYASSRLKSPIYAVCTLALTSIIWTLVLIPFAVTHSNFLDVVGFFLLFAIPMLGLWRLTFAQALGLPRFRQQAVIVGASQAGAIVVAELRKAKRRVIDVIGYVSDEVSVQTPQDVSVPVLGGSKTLRLLAYSGSIDMIIMAIDYRDNPALFQEALEVAQLGIPVLPMERAYEDTCGKIPVEHIGDQWFVALPAEPVFSPLYVCWRKTLDLAFGLIGFLIMVLLLPIIATVIYIDSPGPIFYRQERLGYRGKPYGVLKFRSMRPDAERPGQAVWANKNDPRTTRVGRFLRATHLDELPQVLNILRGEMTLIGPRPERKVFVNQLEKTIPFYRCRLSVKPGLTGWAQVKYPYTNSGQEALIKLQYDLYYIKHQSWTIDVLILLKTVVEVLLCHGR